jgi:hypothetical protein
METKRYIIGKDEDGNGWYIFDRWRGHRVEGGYSWTRARYVSNFLNYQSLGAGPWRA